MDNQIVVPGSVIADRFVVGEPLPKTGLGSLFTCVDRKMKKRLALKLIPVEPALNDDDFSLFSELVKSLKKIESDHLFRIEQGGRFRGNLILLGETLEGFSLIDHIALKGGLSAEQIQKLGLAALTAISKLHEQRIIHGSFSPRSVLLTTQDSIKVFDAGLLSILDLYEENFDVGKNVYSHFTFWSPERLRYETQTEVSDIFCFGAFLYFLICGHPPFHEGTVEKQIEAVESRRWKRVIDVRPDFPAVLDQLFERLFDPDPHLRIQSIVSLQTEVDAIFYTERKVIQRDEKSGDKIHQISKGILSDLDIFCKSHRTHWSLNMALDYNDALYKLYDIQPLVKGEDEYHYLYRFIPWPENEIFRKLVKYGEEAPKRLTWKVRDDQHLLARPTDISVFSAVGMLGYAFLIPLTVIISIQMLPLFAFYKVFLYMGYFLSLWGMREMKRWSVISLVSLTIINQIIYLFFLGRFDLWGFIIACFFLSPGLYRFKEMD